MNQSQMMSIGIAAAILFVGYKYGPGVVRAGCVAVGAVAIAKQVPYLNAVV